MICINEISFFLLKIQDISLSFFQTQFYALKIQVSEKTLRQQKHFLKLVKFHCSNFSDLEFGMPNARA